MQRETLPDPGPRSAGAAGAWIPRPEGSGGAGSGAVGEGYIVREVPPREGAPSGAFGAPGSPAEGPASEGALGSDGAPADQWATVDDLRGPYIQVDRTYILRAVPDGFEIIDQHALHERLTFEELRREVKAGKVEVQRLLTPELVDLTQADVQLITVHQDALRRIGLELEPFGDKTVAVHGLPARIRRPDPEAIVRDVVDVIARTGKAPDAEDVQEEVLHRTSCRSSIMAGDTLDESSIRALLERARDAGMDQTCPHARPTRVKFTLADLEKAFHRT